MSRFDPLRRALEETGWDTVPMELESNQDWALEIWKLVSTWRPAGIELYLSLLIDPQDYTKTKTAETDVWAVGLADTLPYDVREADDSLVRLKPHFPTRISQICEDASALRNGEEVPHRY
jgi:hypothetical protein